MFRALYPTTFRSRKLFPMYRYTGNQALIEKTYSEMKCGNKLTEINVLPTTS